MPKTAKRNTKPNRTRKLTAEEYRVLAEHAEANEATKRKQERRDRFKRAAGVPERRWTTEQHVKVADKQNRVGSREKSDQNTELRPTGEQFWERQRQLMIHARNRRRRRPWYAALGSVGLGLVGQGAVALFDTASVAPEITAGAVAGIPSVAAVVIASKMERAHRQRVQLADRQITNGLTPTEGTEPVHRKWFTEIAIGGAAYSAIVYWIAIAGMSWWIVLVILVGTIVLGSRWWKAKDNAIGPGVAPIEPPKPAEPAQPNPQPATEHDQYALAWKRLDGFGRLTNRTADGNTVRYDVELPVKTQYPAVLKSVFAIAGALGLDPQQVIPEPPRKDEQGFRPANRARITIIERDVAAGMRYWTEPNVQMAPDGTAAVLTNLARFRDGQGEARCVMWNRDGMVPTTIYGGTGSGKSAAVNAITIGAMSTGLLNSIYVDFKGNSSGMLRSRARIVVVGRDAVSDVRRLMKLLTDVRIKNDPRDKQFPTAERPGWFAFIEEIAKGIKGDPKFALEMENMATTVRSLGIWLVSTAHDMHSSAWGGTNTRAAFSKQAFVFYMNTSSDDLINGLSYRPSTLPTYDEDEAVIGQEEQPIPGFGVGVNTYRPNVPARWDWLPADDDPVDENPPYRASAAWDEFAREPGLAQDEYDALVEALGEPNEDGRWIIGIGGTHQFRAQNETAVPGMRPVRTAGFGTPRGQDGAVDGLSDTSQRRVFEVIEGGTTRTADIENALASTMSRATVHRALGELVAAERIHRPTKGEYAVGPGHDETAAAVPAGQQS